MIKFDTAKKFDSVYAIHLDEFHAHTLGGSCQVGLTLVGGPGGHILIEVWDEGPSQRVELNDEGRMVLAEAVAIEGAASQLRAAYRTGGSDEDALLAVEGKIIDLEIADIPSSSVKEAAVALAEIDVAKGGK